ncbi:hypothetical protein J6590_100995 [Homalodisca vitripennis]|nr:hypothetical protein J6590_100995 [Homalodisca vitripennis]
MESDEERRIARLLASVEREELQVQRPTGVFPRVLVFDDDAAVNDGIIDDPDESGDEVNDNIPNDLENNLGDDSEIELDDDDFSDLEALPIAERLNGEIVRRQNNKLAFMSKNRKMLWDVEPKPQNRNRQRNIILMRMGHQMVAELNSLD